MHVFLHTQKYTAPQALAMRARYNQTRIPEDKMRSKVKRRKADIFLDNRTRRERSLVPLVFISAGLWLAILIIATWFSH
jgi:hypothetical protein